MHNSRPIGPNTVTGTRWEWLQDPNEEENRKNMVSAVNASCGSQGHAGSGYRAKPSRSPSPTRSSSPSSPPAPTLTLTQHTLPEETDSSPPREVTTSSVANDESFHTNVGELTRSVINKNNVDLVFVCETFLDDKVPSTYARVRGYSTWIRKDRSTQGGGVAFCHKETLNVQVVEPPIPVPRELELIALKCGRRTGGAGLPEGSESPGCKFMDPAV
ncbi:hypothetical protein O3P69_000608 [Scylla paramamosain]|uniref:Uncharacterized protein n=1 Tax=Scylla paramamosain TaxID=85552 RepID=A0AAW0UTI1_SCYPA